MEEIVIRSNIEHTKMVDTIAKELKEHNETISESSSQQEEERVQPQDWLHISEWLEGKDFKSEEDLVWLNEINQSTYKIKEYMLTLQENRKSLLLCNYTNMKDSLKDIKRTIKILDELKPEFSQKEFYISEVQSKFKDKINYLRSLLVGLQNSIKAESLVRKAQLLFKALKQIHMTLNPLALSIIIKENEIVLNSQEDFKGITEIEKKLDLVNKVSDELKKNTEKRFNEAFKSKDKSTIKMCVQIFFNLEMLSEKIQTVANNVLRTLFTKWKTTMAACHEKIGTFIKKDEEIKFIEIQIKDYSAEVCRFTLQLYNLCISLRERNSRSHETLEDSLQNSGLNNLFNLFWNRVCRIYSQSISKINENSNYTQQAVYKVFVENYPIFYKSHSELWNKFCSEAIPTSKIIFSELRDQLFDSISMLKNDYLQKAEEIFNSYLDKIYQKLSKKTGDEFIPGDIVLKEAKNASKRISQIFSILSEDEKFVSQLFDVFMDCLTTYLEKIRELILDVDFTSNKFLKDFQYNHSIWLVINVIRKMLINLKNKELSNNQEFAYKFQSNDKIIELDAVKRNIEQLLFNHLLEDIKTGIKKMLKAYKAIELKTNDVFKSKSRIDEYHDITDSFINMFFNQKIGDFANNFKELFIDRGSKEENMFAKRSQEILLDSLDYFIIQFCELEFYDKDLRAIISNSLKLFPNLFSPLFKLHSTALIMMKVESICNLLALPLKTESADESQKKVKQINDEFYEKKAKYLCEYPLVIAIIIESQNLWPLFSYFYDENKILSSLTPKAVKDLNKVSICSEELLNLIKYNRNMIKLTNKLFWRQMDDEEIDALPLEAKVIRGSIISLEKRFYSSVQTFLKSKSGTLDNELVQGLLEGCEL